MFQVLVKLAVKDFSLLAQFEKQAVMRMKEYQGRVVTAFETVHRVDGTGEEIHVLEFPSAQAFAEYRNDKVLSQLVALREQAIAATEVTVSSKIKSYD